MTETNEDLERQVVPRWRTFSAATEFGELGSLTPRQSGTFKESLLCDVLEDWRREPGLSVAADVVSAAVAIGCHGVVREPALFVVKHSYATPSAIEMARRCLDDGSTTASPAFIAAYGPVGFDEINEAIHQHRHRLAEYPRNPVLWVNLSLLFTTAGMERKAFRAMRVALGLAPENRFVTRAASRLYLHQGEIDRAHDVLLRSPSLKSDPWLIAAEIATASATNRTSHLIKRGRNVVDSQDFSPFSVSELTGALSTLEAHGGNLKKSRQLCTLSMRDPAENAVAQAAWLGRNIDSATFEPLIPQEISSNEAQSWISRAAGNWEEAVRHSKQWQSEQPFSSRPAMFGSHAASTGLDDFPMAEKIAKRGFAANRNDPSLINNLAFTLAKQNKVDEAKEVFQLSSLLPKNQHQAISLKATKGLVEFRSGNASKGRMLYKAAMAEAVLAKVDIMAWIAQAYLAIEEARIISSQAPALLREAEAAVAKLPEPLKSAFAVKLKKAPGSGSG